MTLEAVAWELSRRLSELFRNGPDGRRPYQTGTVSDTASDPLLFHEYFDGDTGKGLGASHQTGWTALVTELVQRTGGAS